MREWITTGNYKILENEVFDGNDIPEQFGMNAAEEAVHFHKSLSAYHKTPLIRAKELAEKLRVREVLIKDESHRFGLNAFKGLGGSYAMFRILCERAKLDPMQATIETFQDPEVQKRIHGTEFVTCTDGNHGKGVSWAAGMFGCKAHVFLPRGSCEARAEAIRKAGTAEAIITDMSYDDTVRYAEQMSRKHGWILIQDTAWDGYEQIPSWIITGYLTMAYEIMEQISEMEIVPTHIFLQAGVGAMAGGILACLKQHWKGSDPTFLLVEPNGADCVYRSIVYKDGKAHAMMDCGQTIMAGLNCGTPCAVTWPILRDHAKFFISCPDNVAEIGMRACASLIPKVVAGESGAAGIGSAIVLINADELREAKEASGITKDSVLLLINTEGDTDPESYRRIVEQEKSVERQR